MKFLHVYTIRDENGKRRDDRVLAKSHDLENQIHHSSYKSKYISLNADYLISEQ